MLLGHSARRRVGGAYNDEGDGNSNDGTYDHSYAAAIVMRMNEPFSWKVERFQYKVVDVKST